MLCYQAVDKKESVGLTVESPYDLGNGSGVTYFGVGVGNSRALLSDELVARLNLQTESETFRMEKAYLLRCDVDERSEVWLVPETLATRGHALLRCAWITRDCARANVAVDATGSKVIMDESSHNLLHDRMHVNVLILLVPGGWAQFRSTIKERVSNVFLWQKPKLRFASETITFRLGSDGSGKLSRYRVTG